MNEHFEEIKEYLLKLKKDCNVNNKAVFFQKLTDKGNCHDYLSLINDCGFFNGAENPQITTNEEQKKQIIPKWYILDYLLRCAENINTQIESSSEKLLLDY